MAERGDEAEAREAALRNGAAKAAGFYGSLLQGESTEHMVWSASSGKTLEDYIAIDDTMSSYINTTITEVSDAAYYTEYYRSRANQKSFKVWALCQISRAKAEADIANFARNISEPYGNLFSDMPTVQAALTAYGTILAALDANPLHRAVAYYDGPDGRVSLFEYLGLQLNTLAGSVSFVPMPSASVEKTGALDTTVALSSSLINPVGALDCAVSIYGMDNTAPKVKYTVKADNSFSLKIFTSHLEPGRHTVRLELLLNEISSRIRRNPTESFSLEVRPLPASVDFVVSGGSIGEADKTALAQAIQQGIQNYGVPVNLKTDQGEQSGAVFTVTLHFRTQEPTSFQPMALLVCEAAVDFSRNGQKQESSAKNIIEFEIAGTIQQAQRFIRGNESFFQNISGKLSQ
jgi:hypothetical protein